MFNAFNEHAPFAPLLCPRYHIKGLGWKMCGAQSLLRGKAITPQLQNILTCYNLVSQMEPTLPGTGMQDRFFALDLEREDKQEKRGKSTRADRKKLVTL